MLSKIPITNIASRPTGFNILSGVSYLLAGASFTVAGFPQALPYFAVKQFSNSPSAILNALRVSSTLAILPKILSSATSTVISNFAIVRLSFLYPASTVVLL